MTVTDLNNHPIEITDLYLAIMQADDFRHYRHSNPEYAGMDKTLQAYWEDIYQKLLKIADAQV